MCVRVGLTLLGLCLGVALWTGAEEPRPPKGIIELLYPRHAEAPTPDPLRPRSLPERLLVMDYTQTSDSPKVVRDRLEAVSKGLAAWPGVKSVKVAEWKPSIGLGEVHPTFNVETLGRAFRKEPADAVALIFTLKGAPGRPGPFNPFRMGTPAFGIFGIFAGLSAGRSELPVESELIVLSWPDQRVPLRERVQDPTPPAGKARATEAESRRVIEGLGKRLAEAREGISRPPSPGSRMEGDSLWLGSLPASPIRLGLMLATGDQPVPSEDGSLGGAKALDGADEARLFRRILEGLQGEPWLLGVELIPWRDLGEPGAVQRLRAEIRGLDRVGILVFRQRLSSERFAHRWWYVHADAFDAFCGAHWPHVMYVLTQTTLTISGTAGHPPELVALATSSEEGPYEVSRFGYPRRRLEPLKPKGVDSSLELLMREIKSRRPAPRP